MIRCEGLVHTYPDGTRALDGVDLEIGAGERVAIVGRNGSGKSTLVRHWNGLLRPTAGRVLVDGRPTDGRHVAELARIVGIAFQDPDRQIFAATCHAEVGFGPRNLGLRGLALDISVRAALDVVGLAGVDDKNPYDLGRSRRRLLAIASVLAMRTPVVVLDEPTAGLDTAQKERLGVVVEGLASEGCIVVLISHDVAFISASVDRIVRLDAGRVVADELNPRS